MKKTILIILVLILFISGCEIKGNEEVEIASDKELCEKAGGIWNECGSPCTGTDAEYCVMMCRAQCECNYDHKCPENYKCKITSKEKFGVCVKE